MVSTNVDKVTSQRRSRSRTPSRVSTPQVKPKGVSKKSETKKKTPRAKTPTRVVTSTPNTKATKIKKTATNSVSKKRKTTVVKDDFFEDDFDDIDYPKAKKIKSPSVKKPKISPKTKPKRKSAKAKVVNEVNDETENSIIEESDKIVTRRSKRFQSQILNSITEESGDLSVKSSSLNGSIEKAQSLDDTQSKWSWFNCSVM